MNRDDIIRFGEQADEAADRKIKMRGEYHPDWHEVRDEKFAALVAAAEREACAKFLESGVDLKGLAGDRQMQAFCGALLMGCAKAIRARGKS